jgi:hypothetical protein
VSKRVGVDWAESCGWGAGGWVSSGGGAPAIERRPNILREDLPHEVAQLMRVTADRREELDKGRRKAFESCSQSLIAGFLQQLPR